MLYLSLFIGALLIVATMVIMRQARLSQNAEKINNLKRVKTWWVISLLCMASLYIGGVALSVMIYALIIGLVLEIFRLRQVAVNIWSVTLLVVVVIGYDYLMQQGVEWILVYSITFLILLTTLFVSISSPLRTVLLTLFCIGALLSIQTTLQLSSDIGLESGAVILFLLLTTSLNDIAQYIFGKCYGRRPLAATLSPNKTIEGALGGIVITSLIYAAIFPLLIDISWLWALLIGSLISILGIMGDLNASLYKRHAGVKESGSSVPGHGGLLDRVDSLTLTAPGFGSILYLIS